MFENNFRQCKKLKVKKGIVTGSSDGRDVLISVTSFVVSKGAIGEGFELSLVFSYEDPATDG